MPDVFELLDLTVDCLHAVHNQRMHVARISFQDIISIFLGHLPEPPLIGFDQPPCTTRANSMSGCNGIERRRRRHYLDASFAPRRRRLCRAQPTRVTIKKSSRSSLAFLHGIPDFMGIAKQICTTYDKPRGALSQEATMTQHLKTVLIGGAGKTGKRVQARLAQRGVATRLASRSTPTRFDWDDETTWENALDDAQAAYLTFYPDLAVPWAAERVGKVARLAVQRGVERLVLL